MLRFRGKSAGEALLHVIYHGGYSLFLAVPKGVDPAEAGVLGRLVIATREEYAGQEVVGLWNPWDYFKAIENPEQTMSGLWMQGKAGFQNIDLKNPVLSMSEFLLAPETAKEATLLGVLYYLYFDAALSGLKTPVLDPQEIEQMAENWKFKVGTNWKKYKIPTPRTIRFWIDK